MSAQQAASFAFTGLQHAANNFDNIENAGRKSIDRVKRQTNNVMSNSRSGGGGRRRSYNSYDERSYGRRSRSTGSGSYYSRGRGDSRRGDYYYDSDYDSESSVSPTRSRSSGKGAVTKYNQNSVTDTKSYKDEDDSSSSDLISSTDDEKREKQIRRRELITGGLAAVATIHAAGNVWNSFEARNSREEAVANGSMSLEEARKERRRNGIQDIASVGLAALAIKGATAKWKGAIENRQKRQQHQKERRERHEKRIEKGQSRYNRDDYDEGPYPDDSRRRPSTRRRHSYSDPDLTRYGYADEGGYSRRGGSNREYYDKDSYADNNLD